jgi:hypothetical protein
MTPLVVDDDDLERIEHLAGGDDVAEGLLDGLPPDQRDAVRARILEERSYEEIAGALRCSQAAVAQKLAGDPRGDRGRARGGGGDRGGDGRDRARPAPRSYEQRGHSATGLAGPSATPGEPDTDPAAGGAVSLPRGRGRNPSLRPALADA